MSIQGITEDDIANYLANTPGFFERHAALLASVELANPHGQRAVSLQQRQMEMLRERIRGLERRIMEMIRHGQDYAALVDRLQHWTRGLMLHTDPVTLPEALLATLREQFQVPQATLRLWGVAEAYTAAPWAAPIDDEVRGFAAGLTQPYCGASPAFQAVQWLPQPDAVASLALVPIRRDSASPVRGLLVLASPDPTRYGADLGTDFLARIGEIAGAALARLLLEEPA